MDSSKERRAGVLLSYLNTGVGMIISLFYTPVMLRLLGQSEYGVYEAACSVVGYLGLLSFGFGSSYMRFYARFKTKGDEQGLAGLNGLFLIVYGGAAILSLVAGLLLSTVPDLLFAGFTAEELATARVLLILMTVNTAVAFITSVFSMYVNALEKFTFQRIISLIGQLFKPMVTLPLLIMGKGSVGMTAVTTAMTFLDLFINISYARKNGFKATIKHPDLSLLKEVAVFSFFILLTNIAGAINSTIDKLLLGRYIDSSAVAIYEVGSKFNSYIMTFSVVIYGVFIPHVNSLVAQGADNETLTDLMIKIGRLQFYVIAPVFCGFILLGKYFIGIYAGEDYFGAYPVAIMLIAGSFIPYTQNIGIEIQKAKNKHIFRSVAYFFIAVANIFVSIVFIKRYGINGAAIGTALTLILGNTLAMNIYYSFGLKLNMRRFWNAMIKPLLAAVIAFLPMLLLIRHVFPIDRWWRFFAAGILYVCLYSGFEYVFALNESEKVLISDLLRLERK